ncbi:hypothetical protein Cgig2_033604 [Carnegiea gigantea]|uniref:Uncharacterized protein n=1 Tax=Carnegiea gigantea TaxID=171969 RepID=A0A9Q1KNR9_9CARY|nr:hypothetical protein Cgig2_033604 [Carnegiea gigantea]
MGGPDNVTLEINYEGVIEKGKSGLEYKGVKVKGLAEDVGFTNIEDVYYLIPWLSMEDGIDSLDMAECAMRAKKISAYIIHKVDKLVVIPPALPSYEAEKEIYTSKQPKGVDGKRVKHVATKRTSPRGKVPPSNSEVSSSRQKASFETSPSKDPIAAKVPPSNAEVSRPRQKASSETSKGITPTETIFLNKGPVAADASSQKEKDPPLAAKSSPVPTKAQQFANEFEDDRPDSPIPWDVLVGGGDLVSGSSGTSEYELGSNE